jgi:hypothetical protein
MYLEIQKASMFDCHLHFENCCLATGDWQVLSSRVAARLFGGTSVVSKWNFFSIDNESEQVRMCGSGMAHQTTEIV